MKTVCSLEASERSRKFSDLRTPLLLKQRHDATTDSPGCALVGRLSDLLSLSEAPMLHVMKRHVTNESLHQAQLLETSYEPALTLSAERHASATETTPEALPFKRLRLSDPHTRHATPRKHPGHGRSYRRPSMDIVTPDQTSVTDQEEDTSDEASRSRALVPYHGSSDYSAASTVSFSLHPGLFDHLPNAPRCVAPSSVSPRGKELVSTPFNQLVLYQAPSSVLIEDVTEEEQPAEEETLPTGVSMDLDPLGTYPPATHSPASHVYNFAQSP